jgi:hypothetical protein
MRDYIFKDHARYELRRRGLCDLVAAVLDDPQQYFYARPGREVRQSIVIASDEGGRYLLRAFIDVDCVPAEVVTAYLTRRVERYWVAD